ncbi:MAG: hypothetical protein WD691_01205, partial [Acidimicrobiales bacterium]
MTVRTTTRRVTAIGSIGGVLALIGYIALSGPLSGPRLLPGAPLELPWWILVVGFTLAEAMSVEIESRSEAHSVNFVEFAYVAALLLASPVVVVAARLGGYLVIVATVRRQSPLKFMVNLGVVLAESVTVSMVFWTLIGSRSPIAPIGWLVVFASTSAGYLVSTGLVTLAITLLSGYPGRGMIEQVLLVGGPVALANTTVGLIFVGSMWSRSSIGYLVAAVVAVLFLLHRAYARLSERHKSLSTLHDFTRGL